jgi:nitrous oxide reductase accessory protein NosL
MTRPPQRGRLRLFALAALPFLPACSRNNGRGPAEVHWDRDTCKRCSMAVSDRHFAAQVRGGPKHEAYKFDDIGCALFWLRTQPWGEAADTEIWVADYRTGDWLDARKASYVAGKTSPMAYGYGASAKPEAGGVDFATMRAAILARGK